MRLVSPAMEDMPVAVLVPRVALRSMSNWPATLTVWAGALVEKSTARRGTSAITANKPARQRDKKLKGGRPPDNRGRHNGVAMALLFISFLARLFGSLRSGKG